MSDDLTPYQRRRAAAEGEAKPAAGKTVRVPMDRETAAARAAERNRRNAEAKRRALATLALNYPDEYEALLAVEKAGVDAERGPLSGD